MTPKQILWRSYIIEEDGKDKEIDIPQPILDYIQDIVCDEDFEIIDLVINTEDDLWGITVETTDMLQYVMDIDIKELMLSI